MTIHGLNILDPLRDFPSFAPASLRLWDCGVTWRDIHKAPGEYDWRRLDQIIDVARALGVTDFTYVFGATPAWLTEGTTSFHSAPWLGAGSNQVPTSMRQWRAFVKAISTRYPHIHNWEIWNEAQLREFWGYTTYGQLAQMTLDAHEVLKSTGPWNLVIASAVLPRTSSGGIARGKRYLTELKRVGWPVDVFNCHIYPREGETPARWKAYAESVQRGLRALKAPTRPLWVTETNYNLLHGPLVDTQQVLYMRKTNAAAFQLGIPRVYWYAWGRHTDPRLLGVPFFAGSEGAKVLEVLTRGKA